MKLGRKSKLTLELPRNWGITPNVGSGWNSSACSYTRSRSFSVAPTPRLYRITSRSLYEKGVSSTLAFLASFTSAGSSGSMNDSPPSASSSSSSSPSLPKLAMMSPSDSLGLSGQLARSGSKSVILAHFLAIISGVTCLPWLNE